MFGGRRRGAAQGSNAKRRCQRLRYNLEVELNEDKNNYCPKASSTPSVPKTRSPDPVSVMESDSAVFLQTNFRTGI